MKSPLKVLSVYSILFAVLFIHGGYVLSDKWRIDASAQRGYLYCLMFVILPLIAMAGAIHVSALSRKHVSRKIQLMATVCSGLIGLLWLVVTISSSRDGEAAMGYIATLSVMAMFAVVGNLLSLISQLIFFAIKKRRKA